MPKATPTCAECGTLNCYRRDKAFPGFCLTEAADPATVQEINGIYRGNGLDGRLSRAAAEVEGTYYGRLTRVEEIVAFAHRIGARKLGLATCVGLIEETRSFAKVLAAKGLESYTVLCKVGSVDKTEVGIPEAMKIRQGCHEALCNPILQARTLNRQKTGLNVIVGLCVGHDSLFMRHSKAPVTTLITKDRVLAHNPAAALYTCGSYYQRMLDPGDDLSGRQAEPRP
jgi:uncharacterized metal-binding protein